MIAKKGKARKRQFGADKPLLKTIEALKRQITKAVEGGVRFRRFVAVFLLITSTGTKFTVRAVDARSYKEALHEALLHKPITGAGVFVLTAAQAEHLKNRLEEAESKRSPDVIVGPPPARAKATRLGG